MAKAWWTGSPSKNKAGGLATLRLINRFYWTLYCNGSIKQKKKHWRTKILWVEKSTFTFPMKINIFTVLNKWSERAKRELKANREPPEVLYISKSTRGNNQQVSHAQRTGIKELIIKSGNLVVFVTSETIYWTGTPVRVDRMKIAILNCPVIKVNNLAQVISLLI